MNSKTYRVNVFLYSAPVFWTADYWAQSVHTLDSVSPSTPLKERPSVSLEVQEFEPLGAVLQRACDALGIYPGPEMLKQGLTAIDEVFRFGFVSQESDSNGVNEQVGCQWPSKLPVANVDGLVELVNAREITFLQLLISSKLGLIDGDVSKPYLFPVRPQGAAHLAKELLNITPEVVRAAVHEVSAFHAQLNSEVAKLEGTHPADLIVIGPIWSCFRKRLRKRSDKDAN